jgi:hypothetical protein
MSQNGRLHKVRLALTSRSLPRWELGHRAVAVLPERLVGHHRSLTSLKERLIKIGAKVVSHGRYVAFQMAEVAIPRHMFQEILRLIGELRPPQPSPAPAAWDARWSGVQG